jgi:predicted GH43/DUF377 family glycosyl hydrolase
VERLNGGEPIIAPAPNWWENSVTFNPAAVYLDRSAENERIIRGLLPMRRPDDPDLAEGVVAIVYRARPEVDPGCAFTRSFLGLALFTPRLKLLYRYAEPVLYPSAEPEGLDTYGVEDPRITRIGNQFYLIYCGVQPDPVHEWRANLCAAVSDDLLHWRKTGALTGDPARWDNKDGVLFPDVVQEKYLLMHRPFGRRWGKGPYGIRLAESAAPQGPWKDLGDMLMAFSNPRMAASWTGAGSVPVVLGDGQYLVIYHTGNKLNDTDREYDTNAALLDFAGWDGVKPETLVRARIEPLMAPETPAELRSRSPLQVGNVLFACGSYVFEDWLYLIYGGADTYTLAARVRMDTLLQALRAGDVNNPFTAD